VILLILFVIYFRPYTGLEGFYVSAIHPRFNYARIVR